MPKLSDALVSALSCPAGKKDELFFDGVLPGFGVRVTSIGRRICLLQHRMPDGVRRLVPGAFGTELTTHQARAKAQIRLGEVRDGRDPHRLWRDTSIMRSRSAPASAALVRNLARRLCPQTSSGFSPAAAALCFTTSATTSATTCGIRPRAGTWSQRLTERNTGPPLVIAAASSLSSRAHTGRSLVQAVV